MAKFDGRATFYPGNRCFRTHAMVLERVLSEEACLCTDCKQRDTESENFLTSEEVLYLYKFVNLYGNFFLSSFLIFLVNSPANAF